ncbi:MAG: hypothetical protein ACK5GJ_06580 [Planctomycetota bacterium]|jgi:hypothetical protein
MPQYALECSCSATIPVGIAQAGGSVVCPQCGKLAEVPSTKVLRSLPVLDEHSGTAASTQGHARGDRLAKDRKSSGESVMDRVLPAFLLCTAAVCLLTAAYLGWDRWRAPIEFGHTEEEFFAAMHDEAMHDPPARVWDHWRYLVETGLPSHEPPPYFVVNEYYEKRKPWLIGSTIAGFLSLGLFVAMTLRQAGSKKRSV